MKEREQRKQRGKKHNKKVYNISEDFDSVNEEKFGRCWNSSRYEKKIIIIKNGENNGNDDSGVDADGGKCIVDTY